jgi:hypothetical protein
MRNLEHLCRLLAEHLAKTELQAPVGELWLNALEVVSAGGEERVAAARRRSRANPCAGAGAHRRAPGAAEGAAPGAGRGPPPGVDAALAARPDAAAAQARAAQPLPQPTFVLPNRCGSQCAATARCTRACCICSPGRTASKAAGGIGWARVAMRRPACPARLLGGAERARRRAVDLPGAAGRRRDCLVPARGVCMTAGDGRQGQGATPVPRSALVPAPGCPTTPNCAASAPSASWWARASPRNSSSVRTSWATRARAHRRVLGRRRGARPRGGQEDRPEAAHRQPVQRCEPSGSDAPGPFSLVVLACNLNGYGNLCEFITKLRTAPRRRARTT